MINELVINSTKNDISDIISNDYLKHKFEQLSQNYKPPVIYRSFHELIVPDNISEIKNGNYCELYVIGGGYYNQWYYYKILNGKHMIIVKICNKYECYESSNIPISTKCVLTNTL